MRDQRGSPQSAPSRPASSSIENATAEAVSQFGARFRTRSCPLESTPLKALDKAFALIAKSMSSSGLWLTVRGKIQRQACSPSSAIARNAGTFASANYPFQVTDASRSTVRFSNCIAFPLHKFAEPLGPREEANIAKNPTGRWAEVSSIRGPRRSDGRLIETEAASGSLPPLCCG